MGNLRMSKAEYRAMQIIAITEAWGAEKARLLVEIGAMNIFSVRAWERANNHAEDDAYYKRNMAIADKWSECARVRSRSGGITLDQSIGLWWEAMNGGERTFPASLLAAGR